MLFKSESTLYPYQIEGAKFALSNYYTLNRDEPGLGKSAQALLAICRHQEKEGNRALVICPQYLRRNWINEIETWTELDHCLWDHKNPDPLWDRDIVVVSYHQIRTHWEKLIKDYGFDFIVIDESHNFKNPKAIQTESLVKLVQHQKPKYLMLLSGTPIANKLYDLFIPLYLLSLGPNTPNKITDKYRTYFTFCYRFCEVVRTKFGTKFQGKKNVEELRTYLTNRFIGRKKADLLDLPKNNEIMVVVDYKENPKLLEEFENFNAGVQGVEPAIKKESAIITSPFTLEYCIDLHEQDVGPIIVYSDHRDPITLMSQSLIEKKYRVGVIMGGISDNARQETLKKFKGKELDFLLATIGALKEGENLTVSHETVYNDLPWVPKDLKQTMDRTDRIGKTQVSNYHFMTGAVVGKKIRQALKVKMKLINEVFKED